jgi:hypothetical protein
MRSGWSSTPSPRLGTLNAVLRYLAGHQVQLPVRVHSGPGRGEIEWRRPNRETLQIMLHNPVYAGYYAYGRRQVEPRRKVAGRPGTGRVVKSSGEWLVLLPGVTGLFIWRQIDDQRQCSLVTSADLVLRTMEVEP